MTGTVHARDDRRLGRFALRAVDPDGDAALLHRWVTHPAAAFWLMGDADVAAVVAEYRRIAAHPHHDACLGLWRGVPAFLAERYDPAHVELVGAYGHRPGDVGMHFLCAPTDNPVHGFSRAVLTTVLDWLFADPSVRRVVVEPDVRNTAVHALNAAVGFTVLGPVALPTKTALLSTCTRERFRAATEGALR
ncbi:acetyltransferase [Micromonospora sp. R77]|uniref:GNAT family N-acetyltransferase n=1 Tax=Micromonospora sp. R77 TaxID=2925836 RepID=UPI001F61C26B|nr:GNAT family N-acetyltransferase [Micromonospora sp. R77]MCI4066696.1 acetyltransferase [Micromonospora sp. R77]